MSVYCYIAVRVRHDQQMLIPHFRFFNQLRVDEQVMSRLKQTCCVRDRKAWASQKYPLVPVSNFRPNKIGLVSKGLLCFRLPSFASCLSLSPLVSFLASAAFIPFVCTFNQLSFPVAFSLSATFGFGGSLEVQVMQRQ